jgi:hypothetical protein
MALFTMRKQKSWPPRAVQKVNDSRQAKLRRNTHDQDKPLINYVLDFRVDK